MATKQQDAMWAATLAARQVIAQSKNPRTTLGKMKPTWVAYHAAWAAIDAHRKVLEGQPANGSSAARPNSQPRSHAADEG